MKIFSPAKINLVLGVGAPDDTGYHAVDSIFHLTSFGDIVTIEDADELTLTCSTDLGIPSNKNLAYIAARRMAEEFGRRADVAISIDKKIPHGAGLGGGSSNAAAVIWGLAQQWDIELDNPRLFEVARSLGSDVAVFLEPTPASYMTGYGDVLGESLEPLNGMPIVIAMLKGSSASTAAVYKAFDSKPRPKCNIKDSLSQYKKLAKYSNNLRENPANENEIRADLAGIRAFVQDAVIFATLNLIIGNNLTDASYEVCPQAREVNNFLADHDLSKAAILSGSGAASIAFCSSSGDADEIVQDAIEAGYWAVATTL